MARETRVQRQGENRPATTDRNQMQTRNVNTVTPPVDIFEQQDAFVVVADMPGVAKEDLEIQCDRRAITVEGTRRLGDDTWTYRRSFNLPDTVDANEISADLHHGVLRLTMPLSKAARPRRIEVRGA